MKKKDTCLFLALFFMSAGPRGLWAAADSWDAAVAKIGEMKASLRMTADQSALAAAISAKNAERRQRELDEALVAETARGNIDEVKSLLAKGANPQAKSSDGTTALMYAAQHDFIDIVEALLKRGAFVNTRNDQGRTALMGAAQFGAVDVIRMLLAAPGIKVDLTSTSGDTAFLWACGHNQAEAVKTLVEVGHADPDRAFSDGGETCLMYSVYRFNLDVGAAVLEAGANPNIPDPNGTHPLIEAAYKGEAGLVAQMLAHKADARVRDGAYDALYKTVECDQRIPECPAMAAALVKAGADGNQHYNTGACLVYPGGELCDFTPLMMAIAKWRPETAQALIDAGVDLNARDIFSQKTALGWALRIASIFPKNAEAQQKMQQIEDMLRARGAQQ